MNKELKIAWVLLVLGILVMASAFLFINNQHDKVPCYDKYSNIIDGVTCTEKNYFTDEGSGLIMIGAILTFMGIISIMTLKI